MPPTVNPANPPIRPPQPQPPQPQSSPSPQWLPQQQELSESVIPFPLSGVPSRIEPVLSPIAQASFPATGSDAKSSPYGLPREKKKTRRKNKKRGKKTPNTDEPRPAAKSSKPSRAPLLSGSRSSTSKPASRRSSGRASRCPRRRLTFCGRSATARCSGQSGLPPSEMKNNNIYIY